MLLVLILCDPKGGPMNSRTQAGRDTWLRAAKRMVRVGLDSGLLRDVASPKTLATLGQVVRRGLNVRTVHAVHARRHPDRTAMIDAHRRLSYSQADAEINRVANALRDRFAVTARTPVILMMENRVEYLTSWFALFRLGASGVHASYRMTVDELAYQVEHSGARVLIVSPASLPAARELAERRDDLDSTIVLVGKSEPPDGVVSYRDLIASASARFASPGGRREDADDGQASGEEPSQNIVYTSGTTGRPKATMRNFNQYGIIELSRVLDRLPLETGFRHLVVAPIYHSGAQVFALLHISLAGTIVLRPHFEAADTLERLSREHINSVFMVPTMIRRVLDLPEQLHRKHPTPALRALISGAAPFPQRLRERAIERFGAPNIFDFYGATEIGWVTLIDGEEMRERPGSVGRPLAGQQVRILDEDFAEVARGEVGKIWVSNQHAMSGYLRDQRATREFRRGEWVTVDDLGYLDEDDYLYLAGRGRDMVISGGVNIYPVEIEDVIARHPGVGDVAVIGLPDEQWGERLVAVVVPAEEDSFETSALEEHAREHLTGYKVPRQWHTVDEIPRNPTGKILKNQLKDQLS
jgi:long-chain acyl-CoA synthetase